MRTLAQAYRAGRSAALGRFKLAGPEPGATAPVVQNSSLLNAHAAKPDEAQFNAATQSAMRAPTSPEVIKDVFHAQEQGKTRIEPAKKLGAELCTTCRREKHYGPCLKPDRTRPAGVPLPKAAGFNAGLSGSDPQYAMTGEDGPSTSPNYHAATTGDSSLARARDGRPADEQAATGFADLFRHLGIQAPADEWANASNALVKTQAWNLPGSEGHSLWESRGPGLTPNPYEERLTIKSPPVGWGDEGKQRIDRAFDQVDSLPDMTVMEGASAPDPGPIA